MIGRDQGFTILETLVAFAILATVLVALYAAAGASLRLIGKSDHLQEAVLFARSKLDEIAATRDPLPPSEHGTFSNSDISWNLEAHDIQTRAAGPTPLRLQSVRLVLSWPQSTPFVVETRHLGTLRHE